MFKQIYSFKGIFKHFLRNKLQIELSHLSSCDSFIFERNQHFKFGSSTFSSFTRRIIT